jgi:quercetin dioxygenase-like cupin family protein
MFYYVIKGRGRMRLNDDQDTSTLVTGALAVVPAGAERGIAAQERMRILAVQMHHGEAACA